MGIVSRSRLWSLLCTCDGPERCLGLSSGIRDGALSLAVQPQACPLAFLSCSLHSYDMGV